MLSPSLVFTTLFVLLGCAAALVLCRDHPVVRGRRWGAVLAILALPAFVAHMEFLPLQAGGLDIVHWSEFYHYYVNSKYFRELGYTGLYDATVVADHEDDPGAWQPDLAVRSLRTYENTTRGEVLGRADGIRAAFSDERWQAFKHDLAVFRAGEGAEWRSSHHQQDHGYNGSPLVTLVLGTLARQPFVETATFLRAAAWFDLALVLAAGAVLWRLAGAGAGALFLFLFAANPFNDFSTIGGAYLRYLHLFPLLAMAIAHARRRYALSGAALALAVGLRVFPVFLAAGVAAACLLAPARRDLMKEHVRFFAALAVVLAVVVAATAFQASPDGGNPWIPYLAKLDLHAQRLTYNVVSLQYPFFYGADHNAAALVRAYQEGHPVNWITEANRAFAAHRGAWLVALGIVLAGLAISLRLTTPADGLFAGLALVFVLLHLSHYDWCVLVLVPFLFPGRRDVLLALLAFWMAVSIAVFLPAPAAIVDLRFCVLSVLMAAWFAVTIALRVVAARRGADGAADPRVAAPIGLL
jgi:hypothetical protein